MTLCHLDGHELKMNCPCPAWHYCQEDKMHTTERLICLLESVNAEAVNNDDGRPGEFLAEVCREAAQRLRDLEAHHKERMEQVGELLMRNGYSNGDTVPDDDIAEATGGSGDRGC